MKNTETNINTLNVQSKGKWIEVGNLNIELDQYYKKEYMDELLKLKADDNTVVHTDDIVDNLDNPNGSTLLSTLGLRTELEKKANDNTVVHTGDIVDNLDNPNSSTLLSTSGLQTELEKKVEINDEVKSNSSTYSSNKIDTIVNQFKTYKKDSGITKNADLDLVWYQNTRVDKYGKLCNAYFNMTWKDITASKIILCTLGEGIRPSESIAFNSVSNNGVPLYLYMDADGTVGVTKNEGTAVSDGIRIPITYFTND